CVCWWGGVPYGWSRRCRRPARPLEDHHPLVRTTPQLLCAPVVIDRALPGPRFEAYLRQILLPELRPGDIVVMDNLRTHQLACVPPLLASRDARVLYLTRHSPDFNPIEQAFAQKA